MVNETEHKKFQFGNVFTISIAHMVHDIYSSFLAPILPLLIDKLSLSYSMAGALTVIQRIPSLLNPFIGLIADKLPVRYLLIIAPSITAISMSLLGSAPSYAVLAILIFVMGISAALFHVPSPVMIKRVAANRLGKGMSFYMLGGEIARTLGPLTILGAVSIWGLEGTYKLIPFGLAASFILFFKFKNIKISDDFKKKKKDNGANATLKMFLPLFGKVAGITFFISIVKSALTAFLPTYLTAGGESLWAGGISLSILQLAGAFGTFSSGTISDKIGRKTVLLIMAIATPLLMWLFVTVEGIFSIPILLLLGFFLFAVTPVTLTIINDLETDRPSFVNGIFMTINFVIGAVCVSLAGIFADLIGLQATFKLAAFLSVLSIPFVLSLPNKK